MSEERLKPARIDDSGGGPDFGPRFPWRWVILGAITLSVLGGGYYWRQQSKREALTNDIELAYEKQVSPVAERVRDFRAQIDGWIMKAHEDAPPEEWADPRLQLSGLHDAQGLYLRIPYDAAGSPREVEQAASEMERDAIARCLGLAPVSARGLYEKGRFLMPEWMAQVRHAQSMMRLRVLDEELATHIERDLPMIVNMTRSDYFLLVLQHGEHRRDEPVDVWLWDLRRDELMLKTRAKAKGLLLPVRIRMGDAPRTAERPDIRSGGANDCSIAAQVKELAGEPAMDIGAHSAETLEASRDAGAPDAAAEPAAPDAGAPDAS